MTIIDRRVFIKLSAASAAAVSMYLLTGCKSLPLGKDIATPDFLSRILEKNTILETGQAYLEQTPDENKTDNVIDLLLDDGAIDSSSDAETIHTFFVQKIHDDFEKGNTVMVKGWILSLTEARQCALFFLLQKK